MNSFVISQFKYCPIIWIYCQRQSNTLINKIHERALRIAYNDYVSSFETLLEKDGSLSTHQRNIQSLAIEIFKTNNDLNPTFMKEIFRPVIIITTQEETIFIFRIRGQCHMVWKRLDTERTKYGIQYPNEIKSVKDIDTFKILLSKNNTNLCTCNLCKVYIPNIGYI